MLMGLIDEKIDILLTIVKFLYQSKRLLLILSAIKPRKYSIEEQVGPERFKIMLIN